MRHWKGFQLLKTDAGHSPGGLLSLRRPGCGGSPVAGRLIAINGRRKRAPRLDSHQGGWGQQRTPSSMEGSFKRREVLTSESGQGPYSQIIVSGQHVIWADEPEVLGGQDTGPDPYDLVLAGLGACTAMTIRLYADKKGWPLTSVSVRVRHAKRVEAGGAIRDHFDRTIELLGELRAEERRRLIEVADRCPVSQTLQRSSEVTVCEDMARPAVLTPRQPSGET